MRRIAIVALVLAVFGATNCVVRAESHSGSKTAPILIKNKFSNTDLITLHGNTPVSRGTLIKDLGPVNESLEFDHMLLQLKRSPGQEAALAALMEQQQAKGSTNYHRWLKESEFDEAFGVNQLDVEKISQWLESYGFVVNGVTPDGLVIDFSGTAKMAEAAFRTEIHSLQLKDGEKHFSNVSDPKIPAAFAQVVVGPVALHDLKPHTLVRPRTPTSIDGSGSVHSAEKDAKGNSTFAGCGDTCYAFTPGDAETIYDINPLLKDGTTGKGQTIGLIEDSNDYSDGDWNTFMSTFGLKSYGGTLATAHPTGSMTCADPGDLTNGTDAEVELDVEYASATAPGASVVIESCADSQTAFGGLLAIENLASAEAITVPILSISYGFCEAFNGAAANAAYSSAYQHAASRGISIFVSTGDESSTSCDAGYSYAEYGTNVSGFASTPYNVAVGGTDFGDTYSGTNSAYWNSNNSTNYSSALSYVPEIPWNDSCASQLIATAEGYLTTYGSDGFCNSSAGTQFFITLASGSGGPSDCYSGAPSLNGVGTSGSCKGQPKPSWQAVYGNPSDGVRDIPDVSLFASNGIWSHYLIICYSNLNAQGGAPCTAGNPSAWTGIGGTSASSPMMAGIQALINQSTGDMQGNPAPVYYSLASQEYGKSGSAQCNSTLGNQAASSCIFYDITQGDMNVPCFYDGDPSIDNDCYLVGLGAFQYGVGSVSNDTYIPAYAGNAGWDFATGIGSVNAYNLVHSWSSGVVSTATSLTATPTAIPEGDNVGLMATVTSTSGTATGKVQFKYGNILLGSCTLASGSCTYSASSAGIPPGTYMVSADFVGSTSYAASVSPRVTVIVGAAGTTSTSTTLIATPNPVVEGMTIALSASVAASSGIPTGPVIFRYGQQTLGSCTLSGGSCTYSAASAGIPPGIYNVTAYYNANGIFLQSYSQPVMITVLTNIITTTTGLVAQPDPAPQGTIISLNAAVSSPNGAPPGSVSFQAGSYLLGSCTLVSGSCTYAASTTGIMPGTYAVVAKYQGSGHYQPSVSGSTTIILNPATAYSETGVYSFTGSPDGKYSSGALVADANGNLYGTTQSGGAYNYGEVFKLSPAGVMTVLYSFSAMSDGGLPYAGVILDSAGNCYGTTTTGGAGNVGTVFKLTPDGTESTLYALDPNKDGYNEEAPLIEDAAGNLYGTTFNGGAFLKGSVFVVNSVSGKESTLYNFTGRADGDSPYAGLTLDAAGQNAYGTTYGGGYGFGTVFKINLSSGIEAVVYNFASGNDGANPFGGVTFDSQGNLYGSTVYGGKYGYGTIFKMSNTGLESVLHSFANSGDGGQPFTGVVLDGSGNLYGTTVLGANSAGTVFQLSAQGMLNTLLTFGDSQLAGLYPAGVPLLDTQGNLYGLTNKGGADNYGLLYKLSYPK